MGLIIGVCRACASLSIASYAEFCVSLGLGSKGFLVGWLPGFLAFLNFFPLERLSVPGICREFYLAYPWHSQSWAFWIPDKDLLPLDQVLVGLSICCVYGRCVRRSSWNVGLDGWEWGRRSRDMPPIRPGESIDSRVHWL